MFNKKYSYAIGISYGKYFVIRFGTKRDRNEAVKIFQNGGMLNGREYSHMLRATKRECIAAISINKNRFLMSRFCGAIDYLYGTQYMGEYDPVFKRELDAKFGFFTVRVDENGNNHVRQHASAHFVQSEIDKTKLTNKEKIFAASKKRAYEILEDNRRKLDDAVRDHKLDNLYGTQIIDEYCDYKYEGTND